MVWYYAIKDGYLYPQSTTMPTTMLYGRKCRALRWQVNKMKQQKRINVWSHTKRNNSK